MTIPGTNSSVQFVLIDTIILAGTTDPVDRSSPPKGPVSRTRANQQWAWINETLQSSKADWIIVAGHYPGGLDGSSDGYSGGRPLCYFVLHAVWSVSHHGPTQVLVDQLRPMLMAYNVSAYVMSPHITSSLIPMSVSHIP